MSKSSNGAPPQGVSVTFTDDQTYDFAMLFEVSGKSKPIDTDHDGRPDIVTSPGMHIDITNLATGKEIDLNITGSTHITYLSDGSQIEEYNGRNLIYDPLEGWWKLAIGHFAWHGIKDAAGNVLATLDPLEGHGQLTDLDQLLT